jgi:stage II sporulation protein AB (anti-sigma F factor)
MTNRMRIECDAISSNELFARNAVAFFALPLEPNLSELSDIKTAVSEAVTNCIVHAYAGRKGVVAVECESEGKTLHIKVSDEGCGIADVEKALQPFYTSLPDEERSGMGFTIMQTFMSDFKVESEVGKGTTVSMSKTIGAGKREDA